MLDEAHHIQTHGYAVARDATVGRAVDDIYGSLDARKDPFMEAQTWEFWSRHIGFGNEVDLSCTRSQWVLTRSCGGRPASP